MDKCIYNLSFQLFMIHKQLIREQEMYKINEKNMRRNQSVEEEITTGRERK